MILIRYNIRTDKKGADKINQQEYFEYLIDNYQNLIYSICYKSIGNSFDAEDLTQDVFLSAYKKLSEFDRNYEKAWLGKIAVNKCLDFLKQSGRRTIPTENTGKNKKTVQTQIYRAKAMIKNIIERSD